MANVTLVDKMVGKINQAIKDAGIEDHTIVVFTSEHGDMMGITECWKNVPCLKNPPEYLY